MDKCISKLKNEQKINSAFAGYVFKKNFWIKKNSRYKLITPLTETVIPRQKRKIIYREDCGIALASRKNVLIKRNKLYCNPISIIPYQSYEGLLDIHHKSYIHLVNFLKKILIKKK